MRVLTPTLLPSRHPAVPSARCPIGPPPHWRLRRCCRMPTGARDPAGLRRVVAARHRGANGLRLKVVLVRHPPFASSRLAQHPALTHRSRRAPMSSHGFLYRRTCATHTHTSVCVFVCARVGTHNATPIDEFARWRVMPRDVTGLAPHLGVHCTAAFHLDPQVLPHLLGGLRSRATLVSRRRRATAQVKTQVTHLCDTPPRHASATRLRDAPRSPNGLFCFSYLRICSSRPSEFVWSSGGSVANLR